MIFYPVIIENTKDWVDYMSALLTPVIAILGCFIAYRQWRTSEKERKQYLFDKRYDNLYVPILKCIENIAKINSFETDANLKREKIREEIQNFRSQYNKYRFLVSAKDDEILIEQYNCILDLIKEPADNDQETKSIDKIIIPFFQIYNATTNIESILSDYLRIEPNSFLRKFKRYKRIKGEDSKERKGRSEQK